MSEPVTFSVKLHHLAPDATAAGVDHADTALEGLSPRQVRRLLDGLAAIAPTVAYPVAPEVRITAPDGQFVVQAKEGRLRFSSWAVRAGGCELTPAQIMATITGADVDATVSPFVPAGGGGKPTRLRTVLLLAAGIVAANAVTAWLLLSPAPDLLPPYHVLESEPARRVLAGAAGAYETGSLAGDRRLRLDPDGRVVWVKYGEKRAVVEETVLTAQAVQTGATPALLTNTRALIEIKGPATVVLFGDTYRRVKP